MMWTCWVDLITKSDTSIFFLSIISLSVNRGQLGAKDGSL